MRARRFSRRDSASATHRPGGFLQVVCVKTRQPPVRWRSLPEGSCVAVSLNLEGPSASASRCLVERTLREPQRDSIRKIQNGIKLYHKPSMR
ncbi:hypothetical protein Cha6605_3111 [Chamaesiphon minutus PCC 6605]|uniref:Uncharacterized protein n=1 Tax=Chamaesiphon minutus (strain ATCC 27169 / PCC 6605) TaxID=1173020 RepID=K9UHK3_CHAP6|nr:hypothetical protein Cha6605_3111 [Chamaesiphon minutus PCC 6605]